MTATTALIQRAALYVTEHRSEFDPAKPGVFYGNALCDLLGGPDYQRFASDEVNGLTTMIDPEFGQFVVAGQFSDDELAQLRAVSKELDAAAMAVSSKYSSRQEMLQDLVDGSDDWTVAMAIGAFVARPGPSVPTPDQRLMDALYVTVFYLLNASGGLLDLTGIPRPWTSG
jgi:hypothetical protein